MIENMYQIVVVLIIAAIVYNLTFLFPCMDYDDYPHSNFTKEF